MAGLSRSMLHRKLIKLTGKSATELITEKRLEKAKELLEKTEYTSAEIAASHLQVTSFYFERKSV